MIRYDEPLSRAAVWSRRLALFALPVTAMGIVFARFGDGDEIKVLSGVMAGLFLAALAVVLAVGAFVVIWVRGDRGGRHASMGFLLGLMLLAYPAFVMVRGIGLPPLTDITTDVANPPRMTVALIERKSYENEVEYPGERYAIRQLSSYPDITPILLDLPIADVHALTLDVMRQRGWRIASGADLLPSNEMQVEAVATTPLMGFKDDVVVRLQSQQRGTRVDIRSSSRLGDRDFGANADRVRALLAELRQAGR